MSQRDPKHTAAEMSHHVAYFCVVTLSTARPLQENPAKELQCKEAHAQGFWSSSGEWPKVLSAAAVFLGAYCCAKRELQGN